MDRLEQFYASVGSNAATIISRLGGSSALVERFLGKFPSDGSMQALRTALDSGETQVAFRAAHTMKGLCANLGLQTLFEKASAVTELLRAGSLEEARTALPELEEEYKRTLEALRSIGIGK